MLLGNFDVAGFCTETASLLEFIGYIVTVIKVAIPVLIIVLGIIDFGKAVVAAKDDKMKDSAKSLGRRLIAGIVIFFIPNIIIWIFSAVNGYNESNPGDFKTCETCVLKPWECPTK